VAEAVAVDVLAVAAGVDPTDALLVVDAVEVGAPEVGAVTGPGGTGAGVVDGGDEEGGEEGAVVGGLVTGVDVAVVGGPGSDGPDVGVGGVVGAGEGAGAGDGPGAGVVPVGTVSVKKKACPLLSTVAHDPLGGQETELRCPSRSRSVGADHAEPLYVR
jgi:hypothetical protein